MLTGNAVKVDFGACFGALLQINDKYNLSFETDTFQTLSDRQDVPKTFSCPVSYKVCVDQLV